MRAALYVRVSTEEQAREGWSIPAQREILEAFCKSQGWDAAGVYADEGFSAKNLNRPAMQRLIADVQAHRLDVVLVWKLDRLSRRQIGVLHLIDEVFEPNGVGFRSATQQFDTTTSAGKAMLGMLAVFAELEHRTIIERTRVGQEQRISAGLWSGRVPFGYRYDARGALEPDPETAPLVQTIFRDVVDGYGLKAIAQQLEAAGVQPTLGRGRWHAGSLSLIVRNRIYCGERRYRGEWIKSAAAAIVDQGLWLRAQAAIASRMTGSAPRRQQPSPYLLTGLIYCAQCGGRMEGFTQMPRRRDLHKRRYYLCRRIRRQHIRCGPGYLRMEKLDAAVEAEILAGHLRAGEPQADDTEDLQRQAKEVQQRIQRLLDAIEGGAASLEDVRPRMLQLRAKRAEIEEQTARASVARSQDTERQEIAAALGLLPSRWPSLTPTEKQEILRTFIRRIDVAPDGTPTIII